MLNKLSSQGLRRKQNIKIDVGNHKVYNEYCYFDSIVCLSEMVQSDLRNEDVMNQ